MGGLCILGPSPAHVWQASTLCWGRRFLRHCFPSILELHSPLTKLVVADCLHSRVAHHRLELVRLTKQHNTIAETRCGEDAKCLQRLTRCMPPRSPKTTPPRHTCHGVEANHVEQASHREVALLQVQAVPGGTSELVACRSKEQASGWWGWGGAWDIALPRGPAHLEVGRCPCLEPAVTPTCVQHQDVLPGSGRLDAGCCHVGGHAGQAAEAGVVLRRVHQVEGGVGGLDAAGRDGWVGGGPA